MSYNDDQLRGVGGWLAFLVISLMALGPLRLLIGTFGEVAEVEAGGAVVNIPNLGFITASIWVMALARLGMMIFTGWRLNRDFRRSTVKFAIIMLWLIGPVWSVVELLILGALAGVNTLVSASAVGAIAQPGVYALVWTLYLMMSKRVANTYDEDPTADAATELADVFE